MEKGPKRNDNVYFSEPQIKQFNYSVNEFFDVNTYDGTVNIKTKTEIKKIVESTDDELDENLVILKVDINRDLENEPFSIEAVIKAKFSVKKELKSDISKQYLQVNAPALLYSHLRPFISTIVSNSGFPAFNIPFMDFTHNEAEETK